MLVFTRDKVVSWMPTVSDFEGLWEAIINSSNVNSKCQSVNLLFPLIDSFRA